MKVKKVISLFILLILIIASCEKPDYRNKYLGNWIFEIQSKTIKNGGDFVTSDTAIYNGEIQYGEAADEILLQYGTNYITSVNLRIDHNGKILPKTYSSYPSIEISYTGGFIGNNKLHYLYNLHHSVQTSIYKTLNGVKQ